LEYFGLVDRYKDADESERESMRGRFRRLQQRQRGAGSSGTVSPGSDETTTVIFPPTPPRLRRTAWSPSATPPLGFERIDTDSSGGDFDTQDPIERREQTDENRVLWESTLPKPNETLYPEIKTGYHYDYINLGPSSKTPFQLARDQGLSAAEVAKSKRK
jgi:hypothetical protein